MKANWNDATIAESNDTVVVEGNHYFEPRDHQSRCPWKGLSSYYIVTVNGEVNEIAAWYYPEPSEAASQIKDHVAFWKGVAVAE